MPHWHHGRECHCEPDRFVVTTTVTDSAGNIRAVRDAEFFVYREHHREREDG